jgi:hypothetical protein
MEEKEFLKKLDFADSIEDTDTKISYLNSLQTEFGKIQEQDINLFEDRIHNVSIKLNNLDSAYLDYIIKTKIFLAQLEKSK